MKKIALGLGITCLFCVPNLLVVSCSKSKEPSKDSNTHENTEIISVVDSRNLKYNDEKINNMTKYEFLAKIKNNLNKFVIENIKQFIAGDISMIENLNDLSTEITSNENDDSNTFSFILKIHKNRWYLDNKIQITDLSQKVQIINFKQLPSLDPDGGKLIDGKLSATKYKNVINLFSLKSTTSLIKLNDGYFNSKLQNLNEFKNLKVKILSGDTGRGDININLSGTYKDEAINADITISGFNAFNKNEAIQIYNLRLNKDAWIENLKPITNSTNIDSITTISSEQWINTFISNFSVSNQEGLELGSINELIQQGFNFVIKPTIDKNKNSMIFQINATYVNSEYVDGTWKEKGELINWTQVSYNKPSIDIPTISDVKSFLISKVKINETKIQSYYPSYFLGKSYMSKKLGDSYFSVDGLFQNEWTDTINQNYLKEDIDGIAFGISNDNINANDFSNKLQFVVTLATGGEYQQIFSKNFDLSNKTKNINENNIIANDDNKLNTVSINPDFETNSFLKNIKNILKKNHSDLVDKAFNLPSQEKVSVPNISSTIISQVLKQNLISFEDTEENVAKRWEQIQKLITPSIFNKEIDLSFIAGNDNGVGKLNYFSRLYENSFVIESIIYKFDDDLQLDLINMHPNAIMIKIDFITEVSFNKRIEHYRSQLSIIMIKSQWEK